MTRAEATAEAQRRYGENARVGMNEQYLNQFYVSIVVQGVYTHFGAGTSWDEALEDFGPVKDLGNGKFKRLDRDG